MRRLGLDDEIHRKLGGWMSIQSSQGYMVLSPKEQAAVCEKMALHGKRHSAFEPGELDSDRDGSVDIVRTHSRWAYRRGFEIPLRSVLL